jgi:hypothetical protein
MFYSTNGCGSTWPVPWFINTSLQDSINMTVMTQTYSSNGVQYIPAGGLIIVFPELKSKIGTNITVCAYQTETSAECLSAHQDADISTLQACNTTQKANTAENLQMLLQSTNAFDFTR